VWNKFLVGVEMLPSAGGATRAQSFKRLAKALALMLHEQQNLQSGESEG
jgi:hypothetical protein